MLKEFLSKMAGGFNFSMKNRMSDNMNGYKIRGEVFWKLTDSRTGRVHSDGHLKNIVTLDASILAARLFKGPGTSIAHTSEPNFGIYALAVGTGDAGWNPLNPPAGTNTQRSLSNELARKAIQSSNYVSSNGQVSSIFTNVVDFTTTFSDSEAVGPLCEMGLIGGDISTNMAVKNPVLPANGSYSAAVNLLGKDILVNYITFPVVSKPATSTLNWVWRLTM